MRVKIKYRNMNSMIVGTEEYIVSSVDCFPDTINLYLTDGRKLSFLTINMIELSILDDGQSELSYFDKRYPGEIVGRPDLIDIQFPQIAYTD